MAKISERRKKCKYLYNTYNNTAFLFAYRCLSFMKCALFGCVACLLVNQLVYEKEKQQRHSSKTVSSSATGLLCVNDDGKALMVDGLSVAYKRWYVLMVVNQSIVSSCKHTFLSSSSCFFFFFFVNFWWNINKTDFKFNMVRISVYLFFKRFCVIYYEILNKV